MTTKRYSGSGFIETGESVFRDAIQPRLDKLENEIRCLTAEVGASSDPNEQERLAAELQAKCEEYLSLMQELRHSLY